MNVSGERDFVLGGFGGAARGCQWGPGEEEGGAPVSGVTDVCEGRPSIRPKPCPAPCLLLCKLWENMASKWGFHPGGGGGPERRGRRFIWVYSSRRCSTF